jgi:folate-binding protein YgfZ
MFSAAEFDALVSGSAAVRRTDRGVVRLRGADRVTWLQGLVTNDIAALEPGLARRSPGGGGQRIYSAYLTPQGRMITDMWVVAAGDALLLDVPAALAAGLAARLDALIFAEDVQVEDASRFVSVLWIGGNYADGGAAADYADYADGTKADWVIGVPASEFGVSSWAAYVPTHQVDRFLSGLRPPRVEVGLDTLDVLRVEAGVPKFLVDMTEDTIPLEAGIEDRAISFTKGCYVGQEVIVRVTTRGGGRVAKRLVGLRVEGGVEPPGAGAAIRSGDRVVGRVTSGVFSPRCNGVIALGYVHRDFTAVGTSLEIDHDARSLAADVHALPFVPPAA